MAFSVDFLASLLQSRYNKVHNRLRCRGCSFIGLQTLAEQVRQSVEEPKEAAFVVVQCHWWEELDDRCIVSMRQHCVLHIGD